jgi:hypothetical protein
MAVIRWAMLARRPSSGRVGGPQALRLERAARAAGDFGEADGGGQIEHGPIPVSDGALRRDIGHERPQFPITHSRQVRSESEVAPVDACGHAIDDHGVLVEGDRQRRACRVSTNSRKLEETLERIGYRTEIHHGSREISELLRAARQSKRTDHRRDRVDARPAEVLCIWPTREQALIHLGNGDAARSLEEDLSDEDAEGVIGLTPGERPSVLRSPPSEDPTETGGIAARVDVGGTHQDRVHHDTRRAALDPDERTWSTSKLTEASSVLIELADVGLLPADYEDQVRSFGYDLVRIAELIGGAP